MEETPQVPHIRARNPFPKVLKVGAIRWQVASAGSSSTCCVSAATFSNWSHSAVRSWPGCPKNHAPVSCRPPRAPFPPCLAPPLSAARTPNVATSPASPSGFASVLRHRFRPMSTLGGGWGCCVPPAHTASLVSILGLSLRSFALTLPDGPVRPPSQAMAVPLLLTAPAVAAAAADELLVLTTIADDPVAAAVRQAYDQTACYNKFFGTVLCVPRLVRQRAMHELGLVRA